MYLYIMYMYDMFTMCIQTEISDWMLDIDLNKFKYMNLALYLAVQLQFPKNQDFQ